MENFDALALKPSDLGQALRALIKTREPALIVGAPGCGKTEVVNESAKAEGSGCLTIHPVLGDPTDGKGLPFAFADKDYAVFLPFEDAYQIINSTDPLVVFLDDLGQAPAAVQASWMQPVLNRQMAGHKIPDHVTFMAATNRRTDKAGVTGILEPVKGRFSILHVRSDLDDFCLNLFERGVSEYKLSEEAITQGCAFLRMREPLLNAFTPTADMINTPTERGWVWAFKHTMHGLPKHIEQALIAGRVGAGAATEFMGFLQIWRNMPSLDAIFANPRTAPIPRRDELSAIYAVAVGLAHRANPQNFDKIKTYAERMEKDNLGEFAVLMVKEAIKRDEKIGTTRPWIELCAGPVGQLMQGR